MAVHARGVESDRAPAEDHIEERIHLAGQGQVEGNAVARAQGQDGHGHGAVCQTVEDLAQRAVPAHGDNEVRAGVHAAHAPAPVSALTRQVPLHLEAPRSQAFDQFAGRSARTAPAGDRVRDHEHLPEAASPVSNLSSG